VLFLETVAIKTVHRFSWGEAAAALLLPTILLGLLCGLAFLGLIKVASPYFNEIFQLG
jgi:hypothetical protein